MSLFFWPRGPAATFSKKGKNAKAFFLSAICLWRMESVTPVSNTHLRHGPTPVQHRGRSIWSHHRLPSKKVFCESFVPARVDSLYSQLITSGPVTMALGDVCAPRWGVTFCGRGVFSCAPFGIPACMAGNSFFYLRFILQKRTHFISQMAPLHFPQGRGHDTPRKWGHTMLPD